MKIHLCCGIVVASVSIASVEVYAGDLPSGTSRAKPVFLDESATVVSLQSQGSDGYWPTAKVRVANYVEGDRVRLEWRQGSKLLATVACERDYAPTEDGQNFLCSYKDKALKTSGEVVADLIYKDDKDDKEYLLRRFKVLPFAWDKSTWQLKQDDLITSAWVSHQKSSSNFNLPEFRFWVSNQFNAADATLRCSVNGKTKPDTSLFFAAGNGLNADVVPAKGARQNWNWRIATLTGNNLRWGKKDSTGTAETLWLVDSPGDWSCEVRFGNRAVRQLLFAVDKTGRVVSHPMQTAEGVTPLAPTVALIDVRIPPGAGFDQRIKPDVLKKSRAFGLPWPKHPSVAAIHAALPAAVETVAPAPVVAKGQTLRGLEASPPIYVDDATTALRVKQRSSAKGFGWKVQLATYVVGANGRGKSLRLDVLQGKKVLLSTPCKVSAVASYAGIATDVGAVEVECESDEPALFAKGALQAALIVHDDATNNDYIARNFQFNVISWKNMKEAHWGNMGDDLLGSAWARVSQSGQVAFKFWVARANETLVDVKLRCTANGKKLDDIGVEKSGEARLLEFEKFGSGPQVQYRWTHVTLTANSLASQFANNAGAWVCSVRDDGKAIRELRFAVKDGRIEQDAGFVSADAPLLPGTFAIDVRVLPGYDDRVRPDAIRKGRNFGQAWGASSAVKAMHAALPPASGLSDP